MTEQPFVAAWRITYVDGSAALVFTEDEAEQAELVSDNTMREPLYLHPAMNVSALTAAPTRRITSDFAIIDVKKGRRGLAKHFAGRPALGPCPESMRVPVVITGYIDGQHGNDDGTSIEFQVCVESVVLPPARFNAPAQVGV